MDSVCGWKSGRDHKYSAGRCETNAHLRWLRMVTHGNSPARGLLWAKPTHNTIVARGPKDSIMMVAKVVISQGMFDEAFA
jgi:hypothetical protein